MGVGMVWVVDEDSVDLILQNSDAYVIGRLENGKKGVEFI
jgi:phosphoribosylaminoimidazole (AIR) synthetase